MSDSSLGPPRVHLIHQGNLLHAGVRRDITGLNRLFLERVLDPASADDPWFNVAAPAVGRLREADAEALERAARSPVSLFEVTLPDPGAAASWRNQAVADEPGLLADRRGQVEIRRAFGVAALGVVRRLADGTPLSPRIAFGLQQADEAQLAALSIAESYRLASWPGLIRPRWPTHVRYWEMLIEAALDTGADCMRWAYATGLCLLGQRERPFNLDTSRARPTPRYPQRRGRPGGAGVPC
jgi:hypothetical protein